MSFNFAEKFKESQGEFSPTIPKFSLEQNDILYLTYLENHKKDPIKYRASKMLRNKLDENFRIILFNTFCVIHVDVFGWLQTFLFL
jgi:hypothetical protein